MWQTNQNQAKQEPSLVREIRRQASNASVRQFTKRIAPFEPGHDIPDHLQALLAKLDKQTGSAE